MYNARTKWRTSKGVETRNCFKNHRKTGKIYKKSEAETANDHMQENKARQIHRQVTLKHVRKF